MFLIYWPLLFSVIQFRFSTSLTSITSKLNLFSKTCSYATCFRNGSWSSFLEPLFSYPKLPYRACIRNSIFSPLNCNYFQALACLLAQKLFKEQSTCFIHIRSSVGMALGPCFFEHQKQKVLFSFHLFFTSMSFCRLNLCKAFCCVKQKMFKF